jgi:hypothetical protein
MMIAQRRPIVSAIQPQNGDDRKNSVLANAIGNATSAGLSFRSSYRWVANSA